MKEFSGLLSWMVVKGSQEQDTREQQCRFIYFSLADKLALAECRQVHMVSGRI